MLPVKHGRNRIDKPLKSIMTAKSIGQPIVKRNYFNAPTQIHNKVFKRKCRGQIEYVCTTGPCGFKEVIEALLRLSFIYKHLLTVRPKGSYVGRINITLPTLQQCTSTLQLVGKPNIILIGK